MASHRLQRLHADHEHGTPVDLATEIETAPSAGSSK